MKRTEQATAGEHRRVVRVTFIEKVTFQRVRELAK